ncbi:trypsin-1-like [Athalia rosae]|uniref:trypsin-1-like n=1 Tax=Athalia rosae TaxID=37344 RepID=UPI0020343429|nr:trypsin-1-like [Athalia rosae]
MRYVGTFLGVIAVAFAATVSLENQKEPSVKQEVTASSSTTDGSSGDQVDKGIWEFLQDAFNNLPFSGGQDSNLPSTPEPVHIPENCPPCECGKTNKHNRIVGGVETLENQYPWMALLSYQGRFHCGGSIINDHYILTAAHCVQGFNKNYLGARILVHARNSTAKSVVRDFKISKVIRHTGYSTINYNNDIALLKVHATISLDDKVRPVCLPELTKTFAGENGTVTGWGATSESGPVSNTLQEVVVPILSNAECRNSKYPAHKITDNMLCAGYTKGGKDACQGDSGGPLHVIKDSIHSIVGIVSWGEGCAQANYPGVYTRVNRFITWIRRNTQDACYC